MKNSLAILLLLFSLSTFAQQTLTEKFQKIGTVQEAQQFIDANPALKPAILHLSNGTRLEADRKAIVAAE